MTVSEKVAKILLEINAVTLNPKKPYKYASGILSPVYTDCRILISSPKERKIVRDLLVNLIKETGKNFNVIAGTATAGIPHAAWVSDKMGLPMIYIRGKAKDHGKENLIEGQIKKGQIAAVVEDLISTGGSSMTSINAIRESGAKAPFVFAITDYEIPKAKQNFKEGKVKLKVLTTFADTVKMAEKLKLINAEERKIALEWAKDPVNWGKNNGFE